MANRDANTSDFEREQNTMHKRVPNRPVPELKRSDAFIQRKDSNGEKPQFPSGPLRIDRDEIHMLPGTLATYAKAGMTAVEIGQVLHEAVYDNDAPLGHLVTSLVDEGRPYAEIALTVFRWLDLHDDTGEKLFAVLKLGDAELRPVPGPFVRAV